ncbi:MAG: CE1 family esterase [Acidimicrobiales bacterium]
MERAPTAGSARCARPRRRPAVGPAAIGALAAVLAGILAGGLLVVFPGAAVGAASTTPARPTPSPGCRSAASPAAGTSTSTFSAAGRTGTYIEDVPPGTRAGRPTPVVVDLHGYLEPASLEHAGTGLSAYGDAHGFITITPQITESGVPRWDYGPRSVDIAWLGDLLTHLETSACVDERRVFVTGLSMGAFTTSAVACELSTRVAAVAPVAGLQAFPWCRPTRKVPVVAFQGTADPFVAYGGGPGPNALELPAPDGSGMTIGEELKLHPNAAGSPLRESIPDQVAAWARRNGCSRARPVTTAVAADVTRSSYHCPADASVVFYVVKGGGHTWPGGTAGIYPSSLVGRMTTSISADAVMWRFFEAHPLPEHRR